MILRNLSLALACVAAVWPGTAPLPAAEEKDPYADKPYWYKPGHPLKPAEAATIQTLPGFQAERILTVPEGFGSWTALTVDPQGRLLAAAQHEPGIFRITPAPIGREGAETKVERLQGAALKVGWSQGLLYAFDSLYVTVAEGNNTAKTGLHRLRDTDGDGQFDDAQLLFELKGAGEHGPHNVVVGPDGKSLYLMGGNGTRLPESVARRRPVTTTGIDRLQPPGFESARHSIEGWVLRFDPDGGHRELMLSGLRNSYDLAFNQAGDLFTFDSDMEYDLGAPWYRPTRICHLVSGAEFGWRGGAAMWPEHLEDGTAPVVNIGPASPTGVVFGHGAKFPAKYQHALFACDWTFATIHAVHLRPHGASYRAEVEEFVGGTGLPVTDAVIGGDGALYFAVGGRRLGSAIYRVRYVGNEDTRPAPPMAFSPEEKRLHALRRELESLHGRRDDAVTAQAWPHLGHADRAIRFAARVAVETQPVTSWRERALSERDDNTALAALLALARQGQPVDQPRVLERLTALPWDRFTREQRMRALRAVELALARGENALGDARAATRRWLRPLFPDGDGLVDGELARLLCFLGDTTMIEPLLTRMDADTGARPLLGSGYFVRNPKYGLAVRDMLESAPMLDRMQHAQTLLWLDDGWTQAQRRRYFESIADALAHSKGGHGYRQIWGRIRGAALKQVPEPWRKELEAIEPPPVIFAVEGAKPPQGPGREWTLEAALEVVELGLKDRDLANGRALYAATGCALCHRFAGEGGATGPDLSTVGQRFTVRDLLDATIHPSKAISDQYQVTTLELADGRALSGRIVSRDARRTRIATNLMRPMEFTEVDNALIRRERAEPVSTMPSGLLNALNAGELRDLVAYLVSGGRVKGK
jgi:putative heme-binding domain-containing protein